MAKDQAIEEIRAVRRAISAEHGHDTRALLDHYRQMEKRYPDRLVGKGPLEPAGRSSSKRSS